MAAATTSMDRVIIVVCGIPTKRPFVLQNNRIIIIPAAEVAAERSGNVETAEQQQQGDRLCKR